MSVISKLNMRQTLRDEFPERELYSLWPVNKTLDEAIRDTEKSAKVLGMTGHDMLGIRTSVRNHLLWMAERQFQLDHTKLGENHILALFEDERLTIDYDQLMSRIGDGRSN